MTPYLPLPLAHEGKVRRMYTLPDDSLLLMEATDRVSTHNKVHLSEILKKGDVLTALTVFFATIVFPHVQTHIVASGRHIRDFLPEGNYPAGFEHRSLVVRKRTQPTHELIWRNYLMGSLARDLQKGVDPYGLNLSQNLPLMHHFEAPIFTPTLKSAEDDPVRSDDVRREFPEAVDLSRRAFVSATAFLHTRGIGLIDGKFEADTEMLVDEFCTLDSSRFFWLKDYKLGVEPSSLDKELIRARAVEIWAGGERVPIRFSDDSVQAFSEHYVNVFEAITGMPLAVFQKYHLDRRS